MKILFGTVIHPASKPYLQDFIKSISLQDLITFDVLIINDGVDNNCLQSLISQSLVINPIILNNKEALLPSELRTILLEYAKDNNYDLLFFGDSDDTFDSNRLSLVVKAFAKEKCAFFYNSLIVNGNPFFDNLPQELTDYKTIGEYNFVGLSMLAIVMSELSKDFISSLKEYKGNVFDWYLVVRLLLENKKGVLVPGAKTYYRIYNENYAGVTRLSQEMLNRELDVKRTHYNLLSKYSKYYAELKEAYNNNSFVIVDKPKNNYWWNLTRRNNL